MRRSQRLRREVCGDKGKRVGVTPPRVVGLRGNVPTRLRKFIESDWDAIILARAGLERLGFLPPEFEFEGQKLLPKYAARKFCVGWRSRHHRFANTRSRLGRARNRVVD